MADDVFGADEALDPVDPAPGEPGATDEGTALTDPAPPPADPAEEPFMDPADMPPEVQAHFRRMQASFTKRMQGMREKEKSLGDKATMVDKFWNDPAYALQVVQQIAPHLGLDIRPTAKTPGQQGTSPALPNSTEGLTALLTEKLGPDLAFLAPALAPAVLQTVQATVAPLEQRAVAQTQAQRQAQETALMAELDTEHPGWEETYGAQMQELDRFLASDSLSHPTFGSKYQVLLRLLNPAAATRDAVRNLQQAPKNRVGTGRTGRPAASNIVDTIRKTHQEDGWNAAWQVAIKNVDALAEELRG